MPSPKDNLEKISRRSFLVGAGGLGVFGVLAARMYYLQVVRAEDYRVLSEKNRFNFNTTLPERGQIRDRNGIALATNKQDFRLVLVPERVKDLEATLQKVERIMPLSPAERKHIKKDISRHAKFIPVLVKEHIDWNTFSRLNIKLPSLPGILPLEGSIRYYPQKGLFAHVLGYVGKPSPQMLKTDKDVLLRQPTFRVGKTGIELSKDTILRGRAGRKKVEVNAFGRTVREWESDRIPPVPGQDVWLTLDSDLQDFAAKQFGEDSGGIAVMDVMTGELRTLLSMPTYDNNLFVSGLTHEAFKKLDSDPKRPQFNKVVGGGYPPASTFKLAVMLAALENRVVDPYEPVFCTGKIHVGNRNFHCWKRRGHGFVNMHEALKQSCDVYFYELIQRLGMHKVKPIAEKLGLGQTYHLGLKGMAHGVVPNAEWKKKRLGTSWRTGDELNAAIGQGFVLATPLQLAVMAARLANGSKAVNPLLVIGERLEKPAPLDVKPENIAFVQRAMHGVCEEPHGTAYRPGALGIEGVEMAGKTGTGQVRGISKAERSAGVLKNHKLPWRLRDHSVFVGYAPYDGPRFATAVLVEHGGSGAHRAANICRAVLSKALISDGFTPLKSAAEKF